MISQARPQHTIESSDLSILSRASKADLVLEPYPHLVIKDALAPAIFEQLSREFPNDDVILDGRPAKDTWFDYPACKVVADERVSVLWRRFFEYHTSKAFFDQLVDLAAEPLRALRPNLEACVGRSLPDFVVGRRPGGRGNPLADGADVSMECQFYLNYTRVPRVVRGPHVDRPSELFAALLYFRREDDESSGSDLDICQAVSPIYPRPHAVKIDTLPAEIDASKVRTVARAAYAPNTLVLFLNSAHSIHAVSPRSPTHVPRRHVNFCCDVRFDLFDLNLPTRLKLRQALEKLPLGWRLARAL